MTKENQQGAIMVEAAIYFPITIAIVMAVIYLGLFKMQESYFFFQTERAAANLAREIAYPGYESLTGEEPLHGNRVDFSWDKKPDSHNIHSYYSAYNGNVSRIYRWGLEEKTQNRVQKYKNALAKNSALFSLGQTEASVKINNNFFSKSVQAELRYVIHTPGILRFLGVKDSLTLYVGAYSPVLNTTDFVRNIDLASDMGKFLLKKLDLEDDTTKFTAKFNEIKNKFL